MALSNHVVVAVRYATRLGHLNMAKRSVGPTVHNTRLIRPCPTLGYYCLFLRRRYYYSSISRYPMKRHLRN